MDNDKGLIDQVPKVVWFGAGWYLGGKILEEKQAYRDAGVKPPLGVRISNAIFTVLTIVIGYPVLLACAALALFILVAALYFVYGVAVVGWEELVGPIPFPDWWPAPLVPVPDSEIIK